MTEGERDPVYGHFKEPWRVGPGIGEADQVAAGVNRWDSAFGAGQKVRQMRIARGLDPLTGLAPLPPGAYASDGSGAEVVYQLIKWAILGPMTLAFAAALLYLVLVAAASGIRGSDPGALTRELPSKLSPPRTLAPPSTYLSAKEAGSAPKGGPLFASLESQRPAPAAKAGAYLCALDSECARRAWRQSGNRLLWRAQAFLLEQAKKGKAQAAVDLCLLPLRTNRAQPLRAAVHSCRWAAKETGSPDAKSILAAFEAPFWGARAKLAEGYYFFDCVKDWTSICSAFETD